MKRQTKVQTFINTATPEEWDKLSAHIKAAPKKRECLPAPDLGFDFSYSAIAPLLEERGLLERTHRSTCPATSGQATAPHTPSTGYPHFIVKDISATIEKISRSVQLDRDVYGRLQNLERAKMQYTHSSILNQLLRDGLDLYGF